MTGARYAVEYVRDDGEKVVESDRWIFSFQQNYVYYILAQRMTCQAPNYAPVPTGMQIALWPLAPFASAGARSANSILGTQTPGHTPSTSTSSPLQASRPPLEKLLASYRGDGTIIGDGWVLECGRPDEL